MAALPGPAADAPAAAAAAADTPATHSRVSAPPPLPASAYLPSLFPSPSAASAPAAPALLPPSSALAQAIAQLQADRSLRQRLALAGHEQACKRFAQSLMLERMEQVFRQARKLRMAA